MSISRENMYNYALLMDHVYFYKYIDLATIVVNK